LSYSIVEARLLGTAVRAALLAFGKEERGSCDGVAGGAAGAGGEGGGTRREGKGGVGSSLRRYTTGAMHVAGPTAGKVYSLPFDKKQ